MRKTQLQFIADHARHQQHDREARQVSRSRASYTAARAAIVQGSAHFSQMTEPELVLDELKKLIPRVPK